MSTPRPKLFVSKCRCGCGMWAGFKTRRLTYDQWGRPREQGMYADSWAAAVNNAIRWSTHSTEPSLDV
jgi:hypothetical protein